MMYGSVLLDLFRYVTAAGLFAALYGAIYGVMSLAGTHFTSHAPVRRVFIRFNRKRLERLWVTVARIDSSSEKAMRYERMLYRCGWEVSGDFYLAVKRIANLLVHFLLMTLTFLAFKTELGLTVPWPLFLACAASWNVIVWSDLTVLEELGKRRSKAVMSEIYEICRQLWLSASSRRSLHAKLIECRPNTRVTRKALDRLINEWYYDVKHAVQEFKKQLSTEEGNQFAETLESLRLHDSESFYDLIRHRMLDYKRRLELDQEGRRETASYVLYVLAGIPILNTFRVFLYPWIQEGKALFEALQ